MSRDVGIEDIHFSLLEYFIYSLRGAHLFKALQSSCSYCSLAQNCRAFTSFIILSLLFSLLHSDMPSVNKFYASHPVTASQPEACVFSACVCLNNNI